MSFESNTGLGVNNHYGPRPTGGTEGVVKTEGSGNEFMVDLDGDGLAFGFPEVDGTAYVSLVDVTVSNATTFTIGGVDVIAATAAAPVQVPADNTGVIVTDGTTGKVLVTYKKYAL